MERPDIYYIAIKGIFRFFHLITFQECRVDGKRSFAKGAKIIAGNHPNATDGFFLPSLFPEKLYFFVQGDLFSLPIFGWLLAKADQIQVVPGQKHLAFEKALRLLERDKPVAIFPEATLNPDGMPIKSATGAIRLSLMTKTPIIPVGFYVPPKNLHYFERRRLGRKTRGHWQLHGRCYLHIGEPWMPYDESENADGADAIRPLTDRLMQIINDQVKLAMQAFTKESGVPADLASFG
jgi:1-acyl-sn-glycerol-3-phosphate acyltransferase